MLIYQLQTNQGNEEQMLATAKRNIIRDCKQWWAKQPVKDFETWLELNSESLELFQEELFAKEQEADEADIKTKEAAATLEVRI
jgi:hypothetical protein